MTSYTETQTLSEVIANNNSAKAQIKNVTNPTDAQDAATKAYVDALWAQIKNLELQVNGFTDTRDNHHYNAVKIDDQIWMAENLAYLPAVFSVSDYTDSDPRYYVYGHDGTDVAAAKATANYKTYGVLYNWPAVMAGESSSNEIPSGVQGPCPDGWHVPSKAEWEELATYLGVFVADWEASLAGGKMKEAGISHWDSPNTGATNESGFTGLPGGFYSEGYFNDIGRTGNWWSSTEGGYGATRQFLWSESASFWINSEYLHYGQSVRCVKD